MYWLNQPINFTLQITDFGMSTDLQDKNYYISHAKKIPINWTVSKVSTLLILYIVNCITTDLIYQMVLRY